MIRLVVKAPLTYYDVRSSVLDLLDHLGELVGLIILQLLELLHCGNVQLMLCLGLRRLKCASQDGELGVPDLGRHLRMREVLVYYDSLHQQRVFQRAPDLAIHLDQLKVNVFPVQIRYRQDCFYCNSGELVVRLGDNFAAQTRLCDLEQLLDIVLGKGDLVADLVQPCYSDLACLVVSVGYPNRVDALVDEVCRLLKKRAGQYYHTCCAVADLVVLRFGEFDE